MSDKSFVTTINCMDGRVQISVNNYLTSKYGADFVDTITEPGPNGIIANNIDLAIIENIKKRVDISVNHHGSKAIAIVGHYDCAGNPVNDNIQIDHIKKSIDFVNSWGFKVEVIGIWIDKNWIIQEII
ncbi:MAG: carbonic anhydrase [Eubacteriaceae bacterium]